MRVDINLSRVNELFKYHNGQLFWRVSGRGKKAGNLAGYLTNFGYVGIKYDGRQRLAHRIIYCMFHGYVPRNIDHIDGNTKNNKIENLRECTQSQNCYNRKITKNNNSGVKGVSWDKESEKWRVTVSVYGKSKYFGLYDDLELAELVADEVRVLYHGEFARSK